MIFDWETLNGPLTQCPCVWHQRMVVLSVARAVETVQYIYTEITTNQGTAQEKYNDCTMANEMCNQANSRTN